MSSLQMIDGVTAFAKQFWYVTPLTITVTYCIWVKYCTGISDIPGPLLASISGIWRLWDVAKGKTTYTALNLHAKYGKLVRVGPNHVSVGDPEAVKVIYSVSGGFTKTDFYPPLGARYEKQPLPNLFSTKDEVYHARLKRPIASTYSAKALLAMEPLIDSTLKLFMTQLSERYEKTGTVCDLGEWLQWYAFDVIGNVTFSKRFGFLEQGRDIDDMIKSISQFVRYGSITGQIPLVHTFLLGNPALPVIFPAIETFNPVVNFAIKEMGKRGHQEETQYNDMYTRFNNIHKENPKEFRKAEIINHTSGNVLAGSDTTAIALRAMIYYLTQNPDTYKTLQTEIDTADAEGKLSDPILMAEADKLPYLQAVMKEAMRLHPSVGMMMERHVPKGGVTLAGKHVPEGVIVGINPWVIGRSKEIYGEDADMFRPARWLESGTEQLKAMERYSLVFGAGSRVCIGKHISLLEMAKLIPTMLRKFEVSLADPTKPWNVETYWFPVQKGLMCKFRERKEVVAKALHISTST